MTTLQAYPVNAPQEPENTPKSQPAGWAMTPHTVARDARLSVAARLLYVVLDGRQGQHPRVRVGQKVLAADLGASVRQVQRYLDELVSAGLVTFTTTGRTKFYCVHNEARKATVVTPQSDPIRHPRRVRYDTHVVSTKQEVSRNKKASKQERSQRQGTPDLVPLSAAASSVVEGLSAAQRAADPIEAQIFLDAIPAHRRPSLTPAASLALGEALAKGWTPKSIAAAINREVTNPNARAGMTIKALRELSQQPPTEHSTNRAEATLDREWTDFLTQEAKGAPKTEFVPICHTDELPEGQELMVKDEALALMRKAVPTKATT